MPILSRPAFGPVTALAYVTGGTLMCVWTAVWYFTREYDDLSRSQWFWVAGLFLTGLTFVILGLILGPLGRAARRAEMPPPEVTVAEAGIQQTAAANPPAVGVNPAAPAVPPAPAAAPVAPVAPTAPPAANPAMPGTPPPQVSPAR